MRYSLFIAFLFVFLAGSADGLFGWFFSKGCGRKKGNIYKPNMIGCFKDSSRRVLEGGRTWNNHMTVNQCRRRCEKENSRFYGLEAGNECFCGNCIRSKVKKPIRECRVKCKGSRAACGGPWRILIYRNRRYRKTPFIPKKGLLGCYVDRRYRTLGGAFRRSNHMTIIKCVDFCKKRKFRFAGVESATECYCGNALRYKKKRANSQCNMPCYGYKKQACGGRWRIAIYKTGIKNGNRCGRHRKCHRNGRCVNGDCRCKKGYTGDGVRLCYKTCTCTASGDPHYRTYDGSMIHFMGVCKYTLTKVKNSRSNIFNVEVKNEYHGRNKRVSYTRLVDVKLGKTTIRLHKRHHVYINGLRTYLPYTKAGKFRIFRSGCKVKVIAETKEGPATVTWDGHSSVSVTIPRPLGKRMTGLCGNCNGRRDDYRTKYGVDMSKKPNRYSLIGNSFTVKDDTDQIHKHCKAYEVENKCTPLLRKKALNRKACGYLNPAKKEESPFKDCMLESPSTSKKMFDNCLFDFCYYYDDPAQRKTSVCQSVTGFADFCGSMGITAKWRDESFCPLPCGENMVYDAEMSGCPASCVDPNSEKQCDQPPTEGCRCKDGFVLSDNKCVKKEKCGCKGADSKYYPLGTTLTSSDCTIVQQCKLEGGTIEFKTILERPACGENQACLVSNGCPSCVCKPGYIQNGKSGCIKENPDCKDQKADISCSSANGKKKVCTVPKARTVVHVRSTSKDCEYGLTYGLSADGIWVSLGCGGTFSVCYIPVPEDPPAECVTHDDPLGRKYRGTMATTELGYTCQKWSSQSPHQHTLLKTETHNYCRNPDNEPGLWCYTTDPKKRWDFCPVPVCPGPQTPGTPSFECLGADDPKGLKYNGLVNKTKSGKKCQEWGKQRPHSHPFKRLADQGNFCRNPDSLAAPWCYTTSSGTRWEFCDIPDCGQCDIKQERSLNCKIIYKVSGKCFFESSAISNCKYKANLGAYRNGVTEASVVIADKVHILKEGGSLRTCAQFEMKNDVLTIVEDTCKQSCRPPIPPTK